MSAEHPYSAPIITSGDRYCLVCICGVKWWYVQQALPRSTILTWTPSSILGPRFFPRSTAGFGGAVCCSSAAAEGSFLGVRPWGREIASSHSFHAAFGPASGREGRVGSDDLRLMGGAPAGFSVVGSFLSSWGSSSGDLVCNTALAACLRFCSRFFLSRFFCFFRSALASSSVSSLFGSVVGRRSDWVGSVSGDGSASEALASSSDCGSFSFSVWFSARFSSAVRRGEAPCW